MSIAAYLCCLPCREMICLGKPVAFGDDDPATEFFHLGPREAVRNCRREKLNAVLWKFLACHGRHAIRVLMTEELRQHGEAWREVGGETEDDVSMDDYLLGWRGR